jgi:hypothetical protein
MVRASPNWIGLAAGRILLGVRLVLVAAVSVLAGLYPLSAAAQRSATDDPRPAEDCTLLQEQGKSPSVFRHVHWSVKAGARSGRRILAPSIGVSLWTSEALCRREQLFESELIYKRLALAARLDYEHDLRDGERNALRPALELSSGASHWGWLAITAAVGPRLDDRGVAASGSVSAIYLGIDMEVRVDTGIDWDGYEVVTLIGVTNLHLLLPAMFSDYRQ